MDTPDEDRLSELGSMMSESIYAIRGRTYINQKSIGLYPTTGTADDWFYSDSANEFNGEVRTAVYTIELPDSGFYAFLLPPQEASLSSIISYVIPTSKEF